MFNDYFKNFNNYNYNYNIKDYENQNSSNPLQTYQNENYYSKNFNNYNYNIKEYEYQNSSKPLQTYQNERTLKNFENEIKETKQNLENYNRKYGKFQNEHNQYLKNYEKEIQQKQEILEKLNKDISNKQKKNECLLNENQQKQEILEKVNNEIKNKKETLEDYENEIKEKKEILEKVNKEILNKEKKNKSLRDCENEIQKKQEYLEKINREISNNEKILEKEKNIIKFNYDTTNSIDYDIIIDIKSFKPLLKNGWKIKFPNNKDIYEKKKKEKTIIVGVVGNGNKGKSFILQKLSNYKIPEGFAIKTEGLSIKFSETDNKNIAILDSAGQETPLLEMKDGEYIEDPLSDDDDNQKEENFNSIKKKDSNDIKNLDDNNYHIIDSNNENSESINEINTNESKDNNENKNNSNEKYVGINEEIEKYARDKLLSENFLQKFIIRKSNILLVVIGIMTLSEQKLLTRIKSQANQQIIVVHNLQNFVLIKQVKDYIKNTLLKLKLISLERNVYQQNYEDIKNEKEEQNNKFNKYYFVENKEKVIHVILANEYSEAGNYYNETTLKYLKKKIDTIDNRKLFNVIDDIKNFFYETSNDIIEENIKQDEIYFEKESDSIKLKENINTITLKKYLIDELGFTLQKTGYSPKYSQYFKDNKLIFKIEFPGSGKILPDLNIGKGEYIFIFKGEKYIDKELMDDKINSNKKKLKLEYSNRESGNFFLEIKIPQNLIQVRNMKQRPKFHREINEKNEQTGIIVFEYEVDYIEESNNKIENNNYFEI